MVGGVKRVGRRTVDGGKQSPSLKPAVEAVASHEQNYVLNELIIALRRKNVLTDVEGKALLQKLLR